MERTEMRMIRWMRDVSMRERQSSTGLRRRIGGGNCGHNETMQIEVECTHVECNGNCFLVT